MLIKLLKYDIKASFRYLWMLYAAVVVMAALSGASFRMDASNSGLAIVLSMMLLFMIGIAVIILTVVQIIARFYQNLIKGEGYLMHTLPVHTWQLIAGKLLTAILVSIATFLSAVIAGIAFLYTSDMHVVVTDVMKEIGNFFMFYDLDRTELILTLVTMLLSMISTVLTFYAALALGQLVNQHRLAMSFLFYLAIKTVFSIISAVFSITTLRFADITEMTRMYSTTMSHGIIYSLVISVICFVITEQVLRKNLNLE